MPEGFSFAELCFQPFRKCVPYWLAPVATAFLRFSLFPLCHSLFQAAIAAGFHLFPSRTEKLSPLAPMVLHTRGRVGSCRFSSLEPPQDLSCGGSCRVMLSIICRCWLWAANDFRSPRTLFGKTNSSFQAQRETFHNELYELHEFIILQTTDYTDYTNSCPLI